MNLKSVLVFLFITFCVAAASPVSAQDKIVLQLAEEYSRTLKNYQAQKSRISLESVLRKGKAVAERLDEVESLSDAEYAVLEKKMKGFVVNREEVVFVKPDLKFFAQLSQRWGTKTDAAFFVLMRVIRPDDVFPVYTERQTDVSGCTIYGIGALTVLYGQALKFKNTYPQAYTPDIDEEINEILDEFTGADVCACGDSASVRREFRLFIKTFPKDKNTAIVRKRLANLEKNKNNRFKCQSG
jgi:hypothetical protein